MRVVRFRFLNERTVSRCCVVSEWNRRGRWFGMEQARAVVTPTDSSQSTPISTGGAVNFPYREAIGSRRWQSGRISVCG